MCAYASSTTTSLTKLLTDAAQPDLYQINAFRVLELHAECTLAEAGKRQKMLEIALKTGAPIPPGSGRALPLASLAGRPAPRPGRHRHRTEAHPRDPSGGDAWPAARTEAPATGRRFRGRRHRHVRHAGHRRRPPPHRRAA